MTTAREDLIAVEAAIAEGEVVEDFLRSLVDLAGGTLGGAKPRKLLSSWIKPAGSSLAAGLAATFGDEQLRKAALSARHYVAALAALPVPSRPSMAELHGTLAGLTMTDLPTVLADRDTTSRSAALRDAADRTRWSMSALNQARTKLVLEVMRRESAGDS